MDVFLLSAGYATELSVPFGWCQGVHPGRTHLLGGHRYVFGSYLYYFCSQALAAIDWGFALRLCSLLPEEGLGVLLAEVFLMRNLAICVKSSFVFLVIFMTWFKRMLFTVDFSRSSIVYILKSYFQWDTAYRAVLICFWFALTISGHVSTDPVLTHRLG